MQRIVIVGAGVAGLMTGLFLRNHGAEVAILDRGPPGREASWAGGGILSPLYPWRYPEAVTRLATLSQREYPLFCGRLREETGIDPQWVQSGLLMLDGDREAALAWQDREMNPVFALGPVAIHECEPGLGAGFEGGLWMPAVAQVRNPRLMKALLAALERRGVTVRGGCEVVGIEERAGRVSGVRLATGGRVDADAVVITAGAWSGRLLEPLMPAVDVRPVRGQMILFRAEPGVLQRIVLYQDHYVIPRRDGRVLCGSTVEEAGFEKATTGEARALLHEAATGLVPRLADYPVEAHWAGLRPGTPAGIPYLGEHPALEGLYLNCGHFRNGVVLGLASARLVADRILGLPTEIPLAPYGMDAPR